MAPLLIVALLAAASGVLAVLTGRRLRSCRRAEAAYWAQIADRPPYDWAEEDSGL